MLFVQRSEFNSGQGTALYKNSSSSSSYLPSNDEFNKYDYYNNVDMSTSGDLVNVWPKKHTNKPTEKNN